MPGPLPPIDADAGRLEALRRLPGGERGTEARRAAARELQAMFMTQLLRAMRKTVPDNDFLPRSPARDVYDGMFDRSVADVLAARDPLGLMRAMEAPAGALKSAHGSADTLMGDQDGRKGGRKP